VKPSPVKEANRISQILDAFHLAHGGARFPVDVEALALSCASLLSIPQPIAQVMPADIPGFEGGLFASDRGDWTLLYNSALKSPGRIRFTQAHELGHYVLHRSARTQFQCTSEDMLDWSGQDKGIEAEADRFAAYLLMPLNDFRQQIPEVVTLDAISKCTERYGVSLTAALLQWLSFTEVKAVMVSSRDGFMRWAQSSEPAFKAGAFFSARRKTTEIPAGSLAADSSIRHEREGVEIPAKLWFPNADTKATVREMKVTTDQYESTITLLILPASLTAWEPRQF